MKQSNQSNRNKWGNKFSMLKKIQISAIIGFVVIIGYGCSGGGSGGDGGVDASVGAVSQIEGVFIDSPVEGLAYMTETHSGITDEGGRFICFEDEMITFMIGDVIIGQAIADEVITPMDFLNETEMPFDVTHPMITNMGRFLQSLDADGDPENGITISPEVREEMIGRMIDFHQSVQDFENDAVVGACFDTFNGLNMPRNGFMWELVAADQAQQHMIEHMGPYMGANVQTDGSEGDFEHPMGGNWDEMGEYMEDHMGIGSSDGSEGEFEHPMDEYRDEMGEYMEDHMGIGSSDGSEGDFEHPMGGNWDEMGEYMENHMGFGSTEGPGGDYARPMDGNRGNHM